ncbi:MAG: peptide ABC transporter substrate-binding protein [Candidatus Algichlamydia australiensis]|nr:peptide ABC transporter substrate-binding protein [Chlamydiales bacterium]
MKILNFFLVIALFFAGCSSSDKNCGKTIRIALNQNPPTLDTRKSGDTTSSALHFLLYSGLTHISKDNKVENDLAEEISISEDGTEYTFTLREGYWSDGSLITAEDFARSWKEILAPTFPAPNAPLLYPIKNAREMKEGKCDPSEVGISALDERTLKITLNRPTPYFLRLTSFCTFFPMKIHSNGGFLTSGPFLLKTWLHNDQLVLKANPKFHNQEKIQVDTLKLFVVESESTALKMFEQGELDFVGGVMCQLPIDLVGHYIQENKARLKPFPATARFYFNNRIPPFHNKKIRKGISLAIDREAIVQALAPLPAKVATGVVPPLLKSEDSTYPANIAGDARAIFEEGLREEGLESLPEIPLLYAISEMHDKVVQVIQEQLREKLGITVVLEGLDFKHYLKKIRSRNYVTAHGKWIAQYNDPINILDPFKHKNSAMNIPGWESPEFIECLEASAYAKTSEERSKLLDRAEEVMSEEVPVYSLFHWSDYYLLNPKINDFYICSTSPPQCSDIEVK